MWEYGLFDFLLHPYLRSSDDPAATRRQLMTQAKARGITGMTVDFRDLSDDFTSALSEVGMTLHTVYYIGDLIHGNDLENALVAIDRCAQAGAKNIMFVAGFSLPGEKAADLRRQGAPLLRECGRRCRAAGMTATVEDYGGQLTPYSHPEDVLALATDAELSVVFDTGNFMYHRRDALEAWEILRPLTVQIHAKDLSHAPVPGATEAKTPCGDLLYPTPIGDGDLGAAKLFRKIRDDGFSGIVTLENDGYADLARFEERSLAFFNTIEKE